MSASDLGVFVHEAVNVAWHPRLGRNLSRVFDSYFSKQFCVFKNTILPVSRDLAHISDR